MRKWATNSVEIRKLFSDSQDVDASNANETYAQCTIANPELCDNASMKKVLGVMWNTESDEITYTFASLEESLKSLPKTKRGLLGVIARIYDPLGLVSPVTIKLKASFQVLCIDNLGWDDPLNDDLVKLWNSFLSGVMCSTPVKVSRCYLKLNGGEITSVQLHTFVDASDLAYAAISYLRIEQGGVVHTSPVTAKSRVAPLKTISSHRPQLTTPRLELLAAVVGSKLSEMVQAVLSSVVQIQSIRYWSDSMTVLHWIRGREREYKQFVENRLTKIRSRSNIFEWQHVPGEENPADIGSRGTSAEELAGSTLWLQGPPWLRQEEEHWPKSPLLENSTPEVMQEMKADALRNTEMERTQVLITAEVVECKSHSSLLKLVRVTAFVMRFVKNIRKKLNGETATVGLLTVPEIQEAETYWIRTAQQVLTSEVNFKRKQTQFDMFYDGDGVVRCRSRMSRASMNEASKTPIALPHNHWLSTLIIRDCHERVFHNGVGETVSLVKTKYFIPRCRQIAKRLIRSCFVCRCIDAKPYNWRPDPPLPEVRVSVTNPFVAVGVDLAGPMYVKVREVDGKINSKAYIVLFTCAGTRAIHLEMVDDCSSKRYIRALRRFVARRGKPRLMLSDNATNFSAKETQSFLVNHNIVWQPTISNAPWYGGMYERLIKVVKRCLKKVLKGAKLSLDELNTIVIEVEGIVNNRPLTYIDNEDFNEPITPNHLIIGQRLNTLDDQQAISEEDIVMPNRKQVHQRLKHKQKVLEDFRRRWKKEYLLELRDFRSNKKTESKQIISVGDVVIVEDDGPRLMWRLGRVIKLIESKDGEHRAARVLVTGPKKMTELERPIRKLFPLELACEAQNDMHTQNNVTNDMNISPQVVPTNEIINKNCTIISSQVVPIMKPTNIDEYTIMDSTSNDMNISPQVVPTNEIINENCSNISSQVVPTITTNNNECTIMDSTSNVPSPPISIISEKSSHNVPSEGDELNFDSQFGKKWGAHGVTKMEGSRKRSITTTSSKANITIPTRIDGVLNVGNEREMNIASGGGMDNQQIVEMKDADIDQNGAVTAISDIASVDNGRRTTHNTGYLVRDADASVDNGRLTPRDVGDMARDVAASVDNGQCTPREVVRDAAAPVDNGRLTPRDVGDMVREVAASVDNGQRTPREVVRDAAAPVDNGRLTTRDVGDLVRDAVSVDNGRRTPRDVVRDAVAAVDNGRRTTAAGASGRTRRQAAIDADRKRQGK